MKRVMIVTNSLTGGGAERSMNLVSNELFSRGWRVALIPINDSPQDQVVPLCEVFPLLRQWQSGGIQTFVSFLKFNKIVKLWNPDVIVLNCDLPEFFGAMLLLNKRFVILQHATEPWAGRLIFGKAIRKLLTFRKSIWTSVSSHLTIWPSGELPNCILQNPITSRRNGLAINEVQYLNRLVYIGRLSPEKRPEVALALSTDTGVPLLVVGDGILMQRLKEVSDRKLSNVEFAGQIVDPWSKIQEGDLLIVTSTYEGDGLVVLEALQNRVPLLLSDIPDFRRFEFPERNYCANIQEYVAAVKEYRDDLRMLVIPDEISRPLLEARSISNVGDAWENFLTGL